MSPPPGVFASMSRRFGSSATAAEVLTGLNADLTGRSIAITGSTSGIGTECARLLAAHKAHVVCLVRNTELAKEQRDLWLKDTPEAKVDVVECDLGSLQSVRAAAQKYIESKWPLHVLLLNAGVAAAADGSSADGLDRTFAVNHLAHFYLTKLLLDTMKNTDGDDKRIVIVSSEAHRRGHSIPANITVEQLTESRLITPHNETGFVANFRNYGDSKLFNIWFANQLAAKLKDDGISVYSLHPGIIETGLSRHSYARWGWRVKIFMTLSKPFQKSVPQGAATSAYCVAAPELKGVTGHYYDDCWVRQPSALAQRNDLAEKLWQISESLVGRFEAGQLNKGHST